MGRLNPGGFYNHEGKRGAIVLLETFNDISQLLPTSHLDLGSLAALSLYLHFKNTFPVRRERLVGLLVKKELQVHHCVCVVSNYRPTKVSLFGCFRLKR